MENIKLLALLFISSVISFNFQSCSSPNSQKDPKVETTNSKEEEAVKGTKIIDENIAAKKETNASVDSDLKFIKDKYAIITGTKNYKIDSTTVDCEQGSSRIERRSTEKGELRYLLEDSCGEHGCVTTHHYFWEDNLIFIFRQNYYYAGNSEYVQEHRTYFKNNKMFHCLEKEISTNKGYETLKELLQKAPNKTVDCSPNKRTLNLQNLMELDIKKAKEYFCY